MKYEQPVLSTVSEAAELILGGISGPDDNPIGASPLLNPGELGLDD